MPQEAVSLMSRTSQMLWQKVRLQLPLSMYLIRNLHTTRHPESRNMIMFSFTLRTATLLLTLALPPLRQLLRLARE
jgi:hypothetical protein